MDVRNAIVDLWELAGEPSDLDPWMIGTVNYDPLTDLDPASAGVSFYLKQLSLAQVALSNWRTRRGRPIRFKKFQVQNNVKIGRDVADYSYSITRIDGYTIRLSNPDATLTEDNLRDTKLILNWSNAGGDEYVEDKMSVMAVYDAGNNWYTITFREEIEADSNITWDTSTVDIYWDRFRIVRSTAPLVRGNEIQVPNKFRNIIKLINMTDGKPIQRAASKESLFNPFMNFGVPSEWYDLGEILYLDQYVEDPIWHIMEYQKLPDDVSGLDDVFDIPEEWHEVIILIVEWRTMKRMQDKQRANELFVEINRWIDTLRTDLEEDWLRDHTSGFQIRKEAR